MILIGVPTYDGKVVAQLMVGFLEEATNPKTPRFTVATNSSSLLARGFNELFTYALNSKFVDKFMMVHADISPERGFISMMDEEMRQMKAGILSVVMPLKDNRGLTSTAFHDGAESKINPRRVSMRELKKLPKSFTARDVKILDDGEKIKDPVLLVNSGLMMVDLKNPGNRELFFNIFDTIECVNSEYVPQTLSEDWFFSMEAHRRKIKVVATTKIRALHYGNIAFPNYGSWGTHGKEDYDVSEIVKSSQQIEVTDDR